MPQQAFSYDADGNLLAGYRKDGTPFSAAYDAENRLISLKHTDNAGTTWTARYAYSGDGLLATVTGLENSRVISETRIVRDGGLDAQDRNGSNIISREYAWGVNFGGGIGGLLHMRSGAREYSYVYDASGNVEAVLDSAQQVVAAYRYDPFGNLLAQRGTFTQPFRFMTKRTDTGAGLVSFGYRFYAPHLGRWLTRDPLGEAGGLNLYAYVGNNPVNWVDPWGLTKIIMVGSNVKNPSFFNNIANAMAGIDTDTIIVQVRTPQHIQQALQYPNITQITYFGHAGPEELDISPQRALTKKDVLMLNTSNVQSGAEIRLYGCRTGEGENPIAQVFADHFRRQTMGMTTGLSFGIPMINRLSPNSPFFWWPRGFKKWFSPRHFGASGGW